MTTWRDYATLKKLFAPHEKNIVQFETTVERRPTAFVEASGQIRVPPIVRSLALTPLLYRPDADTEHLLALTDRVAERVLSWESVPGRARSVRNLCRELMSNDTHSFRGAWAEACFLVWLDERGLSFQPGHDITTPALKIPTKAGAQAPNVDAHVTTGAAPSCWDSKAYSMPAFDVLLRDLKDDYRAVLEEVRPDLDILFALAHDVERMGDLENPDPRTLPGAAVAIRVDLPRFRAWLALLPRPCPPGTAFDVRGSDDGPPVLTVRVFPHFVPFTVGGQESEEVAYQLRRKLAEREQQLHDSEPNVRVVVRDPFTSYEVYSTIVWMAALGYLRLGEWDEQGRPAFTEGVVALTSEEPLNQLPGNVLSDKLHAVVYFDPQAAFRPKTPLLFPLSNDGHDAMMFVRPDRASSPLCEVGRALGCRIESRSIPETEGFMRRR